MVVVHRDERVDILRCIALIGIVIAHSEPNAVLFQLRNFDVVLMVLLLGTSFYLSTLGKSNVPYREYLKKRFYRLVLPVWIFLTIFFAFYFILSRLLNEDFYFKFLQIVSSYSLINGIGYVWILRVFVVIALFSPLLHKISRKIESNLIYFLMLCAGYGIYSLFILLGDVILPESGAVYEAYNQLFLYACGYLLIAAFGIRLKQFARKDMILLTCIFTAICLGLAWYHDFAQTQNFKYPPTMYYLSYGLAVGLGLYLLLESKILMRLFSNRVTKFISKTSLWLYFWHIIPIYIVVIYKDQISLLRDHFSARLIFIFGIAILLTYIQESLLSIKRKKSGIN